MCIYIKDDGEQCGMDDEPFCRHHEDSAQADVYQMALTAAESDSSLGGVDTVCGNCEAPLRRTERLREHPNRPRHVVFEAVVECDCHELVLGSTGVRKQNLSTGWSA